MAAHGPESFKMARCGRYFRGTLDRVLDTSERWISCFGRTNSAFTDAGARVKILACD
jgi:hypothetical protein